MRIADVRLDVVSFFAYSGFVVPKGCEFKIILYAQKSYTERSAEDYHLPLVGTRNIRLFTLEAAEAVLTRKVSHRSVSNIQGGVH